VVDNISNPEECYFNIEQNGTVVSVPYGEKVPYRLTMQKSSANVFDYKDVKFACNHYVMGGVLQSGSNGILYQHVQLLK
jgi:hypothetical protein